MVIGLKVQRRLLDPKQCYELWAKVGSVYKVPLVLKNEFGMVNEKTGKLYTPQGIWNSATNYIIENMVDAKVIFLNVWKANGRIATDAEWYKFVLEKAKYLSPKRYNEFMEKHSYLKPYLT